MYKNKEKQTSDVIFYGLWQTTDTVDEILKSIKKVTEKRKTLVAQLRFRQNVLKQYVKICKRQEYFQCLMQREGFKFGIHLMRGTLMEKL